MTPTFPNSSKSFRRLNPDLFGLAHVVGADAARREVDLHDQILDVCRRRGWYVVHSRMDMRTTTAVGVPDFVIAGHDGRTWWIEAKAAKGKLTPEQQAAQLWLRTLGHTYDVVRSIAEFEEMVK